MNEETFLRLMHMATNDTSTLRRIFDSCWEQYMEYLSNIASDIYDSCIQDYYQWTPSVYDRHGYPEGKNLYQANQIGYTSDDIVMTLDPYNLWEYRGAEKRERVLGTVMDGIRGGGARTRSFRGWPKSWSTSYPNNYSSYDHVWSSSGTTMNEILSDFLNTAISSTEDYFINLFFNSI